MYINTHTCNISEKYVSVYIKYIYLNISRHVNTCKDFQNIYCICVDLYLHNKYTQNTHIYYANKNLYFVCDYRDYH